MKTVALIATITLLILNVFAMFACFFIGVWNEDIRWGQTGFVLFFCLFATAGMAGIAWSAKND